MENCISMESETYPMLPELKRSGRIREWDSFSQELRDRVVFEYLFKGLTHRELDRSVLSVGFDSRGYQSMSILHYMGLTKEFKSIFASLDYSEAVSALNDAGKDYHDVRDAILRNLKNPIADDVESNAFRLTSKLAVEDAKEGRKVLYYTTKYERKPILRRKAIAIHGFVCMACGFDFEARYGEIGRGFIEVHHVRPLKSLDQEVVVNPETDLVCVCSNCHRMIHRLEGEILGVDELKNIISLMRRPQYDESESSQ